MIGEITIGKHRAARAAKRFDMVPVRYGACPDQAHRHFCANDADTFRAVTLDIVSLAMKLGPILSFEMIHHGMAKFPALNCE